MANKESFEVIDNSFPKKVIEWGDILSPQRKWITRQIQILNEYGPYKNSVLFLDHDGDFQVSPEWPDIEHYGARMNVHADGQSQLLGVKYHLRSDELESASFFRLASMEISDLLIYWSRNEN